MPEPARFLVTTADIRTWQFDRPVLFLGEWCRWHAARERWSRMDAVVARPYGTTRAELDRDLAAAARIEAAIWPALASALNGFHGVRRPERYWRILAGNWVRRFVHVAINRYQTLLQVLAENEISGTAVLSRAGPLATGTSLDFIWACNDPAWGGALYARILDLIAGADFPRLPVAAGLPARYGPEPAPPPASRAGRWLRRLRRETDVVLDRTYLPRREAVLLHLALGQAPQEERRGDFAPVAKADVALRRSFAAAMPFAASPLDSAVARLLFELLPVCYLEGLKDLKAAVVASGLPLRPRAIVTSNSFDTDEVFKLWAAERATAGTPYIVGQHGNAYGTHREFTPSPEEGYADRFVTWGWSRGAPNTAPAFCLKRPRAGMTRHDRSGGVLLIELSPAFQIYLQDKVHRFESWFSDQLAFVGALDAPIRGSVTVRLAGGSRHLFRAEDELWQQAFPGIALDRFEAPLGALIARSRIVVHSYDSTGLLETLNQNIPTLAFWQDGFDHLNDEVIADYEVLVEAGIVHFTGESAAARLNAIHDEVGAWWASRSVQAARRHFIDRYARRSRTPVLDFRRIVQDAIREKRRR